MAGIGQHPQSGRAIDDGYGRAFADQVATAIRRNGTEVVAQTVFDDSELSLREAAQAVADADPDVVTVIADGLRWWSLSDEPLY